jgi:hypothetical protein
MRHLRWGIDVLILAVNDNGLYRFLQAGARDRARLVVTVVQTGVAMA